MKKSNWPTTSRQERGYGTEWEKVRKFVLKRDMNLCQCAKCKGGELELRIATEVHHIVSKAEGARLGWPQARIDHPDNLQAINKQCHMRETAAEQGRILKEKRVIGIDGWPVETV